MSKLEEIVQPVVESMGYEYIGLEVHAQAGGAVLRLYVDTENGVNVADCEAISRRVGSVLDVEGVMNSTYTLEVSSPGIERKLFTVAQCEKQLGQQVKIKLAVPATDGRRNFAGRLQRVDGNELYVDVDGTEVMFHFGDVEKIQTVLTW